MRNRAWGDGHAGARPGRFGIRVRGVARTRAPQSSAPAGSVVQAPETIGGPDRQSLKGPSAPHGRFHSRARAYTAFFGAPVIATVKSTA